MNGRRVLINTGLGVLVLGLGIAGVAALAAPRQDPTANLPTATVQRGALEATVTASGNVESGATASLQLKGTGGIVTKVYVTTGQEVSRGDKLVRVDDTDAQAQLDSALVALDSAEASLQTATQGRTGAERRYDAAAVASAEQNLRNAERALASARDSYDLVRKQQGDLVSIAQDAVDAAQLSVDLDQQQLAALEQQLAATDPADTATIAALEAQITQLEAQLAADQATLKNTSATLAQAKRTRDTAVQQAKQSVTTQTGSRDAARKSLAQQKATVAVNQQGPKPGSVNAANAQVESAQLQVDKARQAVEDTVLVAPFDGVVSTVNAVVGQSSSMASASAAGASGLVVLVDPDGLRVTASIAEADATSVQVGQLATVNLPASGLDIAGEVISVDIASTVTNNVVQYVTTVSLSDPPAGVRVGQTASLSIITGSEDDVLFVPTSAITVDGASSYVTRLADGVQTRVEVETGLVGTTGTQILGGLAEGDVVVLPSSGGTTSLPFPGSGGGAER
ncbi:MAG: HlyD family efflux transporter periplasmic adaptor subunit [Propionicimonas sp.]|nr:HlyD family efflux transporter periplasmic adaptor subunit [Propionicimonas sp.]